MALGKPEWGLSASTRGLLTNRKRKAETENRTEKKTEKKTSQCPGVESFAISVFVVILVKFDKY